MGNAAGTLKLFYRKEADHETGDNHCRVAFGGHFHCPFTEANSSGGHRCKWDEHSYLVEHLGMYCPCCTGVHAMAGE
jgi:hypothetical protein